MTTLETYATELIELVCKRNGITPEDLLAATYWPTGRRRTVRFKSKPYARARLDVCRVLRGTVLLYENRHLHNKCGYHGVNNGECLPSVLLPGTIRLSYPACGRLLGGLNHATLVLAVGKAGKRGEPRTLTWDEYAALTPAPEGL